MLDFDVSPVAFRVNGATYWLAPMTLDDAAAISSHAESTKGEQIIAMRELIASKATSRVPGWWLWLTRRMSPADAVRSLGPAKQAQLFGEWISEYRSVSLGESSGSAVS